jgi:hypothetical protein
MSRRTISHLVASAGIAVALTLASSSAPEARAVPVQARFAEDPRCDVLPAQPLSHELGNAAIFPPNEAIISDTQPVTFTVCVQNDGLANDWLVQMVNVSGIAWQDLFFVCDQGVTVGNADGTVADVALAPNVFTDAFRIDGTVTPGINNNLLFESGPVDEIFQPGETWRFAVSNFMALNAAGGFQPPRFNTPGVFAGSSPFGPNSTGNASILANPVPEPGLLGGALGLGAAALLLRRRARRACTGC